MAFEAFKELEGKTIVKVVEYGPNVALTFSDGTRCRLKVEFGWEAGDGSIGIGDSFDGLDDFELCQLGVITKEEHDRRLIEKVKQEYELQKQREREMLRELKKKYPEEA